MSHLRQIPDLQKLKKLGAIDSKSYKEIKAAMEGRSKILIIGAKNSGKNTLQDALVNHLHRMYKAPLVIPSFDGVPTKKFRGHKKLKNLKKTIKGHSSYVACIQHSGSDKADISDLSTYLLSDFDLIIDIRNIKGKRIVCSLIKGRTKANFIYTNPKFENFLIAA
jgi:hypothetical protein